jgi:hypothetical protein
MVPLPAPVTSPPGPRRTRQSRRRKYNPFKTIKNKKGSNEGGDGSSWDLALAQFRAKLNDIARNGQPPGGLSPETTLVANITKSIKEDLERSVTRIFYCVLVHHFTDFATLTIATPVYRRWKGKTTQGRGGLPYRHTEGNLPSRANSPREPGSIERDQNEGSCLCKT